MKKVTKKQYSHAPQFVAQHKRIEQAIGKSQLQLATQLLNQLAPMASHDPRLFLLGSRVAEVAGNAEGMLQAAHKAHQLEPQWPVASARLADVLASRGEAKQALAMAGLAMNQAVTQNTLDVELLSKAVMMARRFGQHALALQWLRESERFFPNDVNHKRQVALCLADCGDFDSALTDLSSLLQMRPGDPVLLGDRFRTAVRAGQFAQAIADGQALLALDPGNEEWVFYLSVARGETPPTLPGAMVTALFDQYAARFDREMVVQLKYKLPREVAAMVERWFPEKKVDVLDLGCGTGLLGVCLGPIRGAMVGVDLSAEMIAQASRHGVYHQFHQVNVLDALRATPDAEYSLITALDVFTYVGDLGPVIGNANRILSSDGRFVFSCEDACTGEADYSLRGAFRYQHKRGYVQRLLEDAGFQHIQIEDRILRYEADAPVTGFLVVACKGEKQTAKLPKRTTRSVKVARATQ